MIHSRRDQVGYISSVFHASLRDDYGVPPDTLMPVINGIYLDSRRYSMSDGQRVKLFREHSIPEDKEIIFASGRCVYQKGYDLLVPAAKQFILQHPEFHLLLLMPKETSIQEYAAGIDRMIADFPAGACTPVNYFSPHLPYAVLTHNKLAM